MDQSSQQGVGFLIWGFPKAGCHLSLLPMSNVRPCCLPFHGSCSGLSMEPPSPLPAIRLEPRAIFEMAEGSPLKLLLPPSLRLWERRDRLWASCGEEGLSGSPVLATTSREMPPRQNGHAGAGSVSVVGLGLLWQHRASVQVAHIWCPQSCTSMVHAWSKQMEHSSVSLTCDQMNDQSFIR